MTETIDRPANRMGRRKTEGVVLVHIQIRVEQSKKLALLAAQEDMTQAALIRKGIDMVLAKRLGKPSE